VKHDLSRDERMRLLRELIDRQMAAKRKILRDLEDLDEATRIACGEFMDLVSASAPEPDHE
jgi:hypothetical protein